MQMTSSSSDQHVMHVSCTNIAQTLVYILDPSANSTVAQKGHTCKLKMMLQTKNFTCILKMLLQIKNRTSKLTGAHQFNNCTCKLKILQT